MEPGGNAASAGMGDIAGRPNPVAGLWSSVALKEQRSYSAASGPPAFEPRKVLHTGRGYAAIRSGTCSTQPGRLDLLTVNPDQALGDCDANGVQPVPRAEFALGAGKLNLYFIIS